MSIIANGIGFIRIGLTDINPANNDFFTGRYIRPFYMIFSIWKKKICKKKKNFKKSKKTLDKQEKM
jgi:hypothetical protein